MRSKAKREGKSGKRCGSCAKSQLFPSRRAQGLYLTSRYRQREGRVVTNVVGSAKIVLATCHSAGSRQLNNLQFDVCIIDEATQGLEAVCWVPILKCKKLILAGDPQQVSSFYVIPGCTFDHRSFVLP